MLLDLAVYPKLLRTRRAPRLIASCVLLRPASFGPLFELIRLANCFCLMCSGALLDLSIFSGIGHTSPQLFFPLRGTHRHAVSKRTAEINPHGYEQFVTSRCSPKALLAMQLSGFCGFGCSLEPMPIGMLAELVPVCLGKVHAVIFSCLFNVGKR